MRQVIQPKRTATTVGILFIIATMAGVISVALIGSILDPQGILDNVAADDTNVVLAVLFDLVLAGAVIAIPVVVFPVLKQQSEGVARGYFAARLLEGMVIVLGAIVLLTLVAVSRETADVVDSATEFGSIGSALVAARDWTDMIGTQLVFGVTALILNLSMFRSLLVPRFISIWGLIGAALAIVSTLSIMLLNLDPFSTASIVLLLPIAVQEMVMAIWFIVKGFNLSAGAGESA